MRKEWVKWIHPEWLRKAKATNPKINIGIVKFSVQWRAPSDPKLLLIWEFFFCLFVFFSAYRITSSSSLGKFNNTKYGTNWQGSMCWIPDDAEPIGQTVWLLTAWKRFYNVITKAHYKMKPNAIFTLAGRAGCLPKGVCHHWRLIGRGSKSVNERLHQSYLCHFKASNKKRSLQQLVCSVHSGMMDNPQKNPRQRNG